MPRDLSLYDQKRLLERIAGGDIPAFRDLFDAYRDRLYAAAFKITKSAYAAEETVQEIFAAIWESRSGLRDVADPAAYIFTIAYNKSFRYLKKVAADKTMLASLSWLIKESQPKTSEWLELKESLELIDHAVEELPPQRQLIYRLRQNGLSHKQIAEKLNISPLTVKKQLVLALRNIRSAVGKKAWLIIFF